MAARWGLLPVKPRKTLAPLAIPDIKPQVAVVSPVASVKFSPDGKCSRWAAIR